MNQIVVSRINDACEALAPATPKKLKVWLKIRSTGALFGSGAGTTFFGGDEIRCEKEITTTTLSGTSPTDRIMSIDAGHLCENMTLGTLTVTLNSISARDLAESVGFEIG